MTSELIHGKLDDFQSCEYKNIITRIKKYEYVSFDIFDTLIKRDVPRPVDLFDLVGYKLNLLDFKDKRICAEKQARKLSKKEEVTLDEIYSQLKDYDEKVINRAKQTEIELEYEVAVPNKEIQPIYEYCKKNKKIIIISDMYLKHSVIEKLLIKCGFDGYKALYLSSEVMKTKAHGELFDYVCTELNTHSIIHIGNSFKADYCSAKKAHISSIKISTSIKRIDPKTQKSNLRDNRRLFLTTFLNNHTEFAKSELDKYFKFGFERFGPLLYGFTNWLIAQMKADHIQQVLFLSRDGFIMQKAYHELTYSNVIPDYYFEASRRSLRVPSYSEACSFDQIIKELTVPNMTNLAQIFDSLGLDVNIYGELIDLMGMDRDKHLKRDTLFNNKSFKKIYEKIHPDIIANAKNEAKLLQRYLNQFDFKKKTAIVDIGWGGSMQKYLTFTLRKMNKKSNIVGYYIGLTEKSIENLRKNNLCAKGYAFDQLNDIYSEDLERPFVGLFETLFLEQKGSVMRYKKSETNIVAERYPYEYKIGDRYSKECALVEKVQEGALRFINEYKKSIISDYIGYDSSIMFENLYRTGVNPTLNDVKMFGDFTFFNNGNKVYLAKPSSIAFYIRKPKKLINDLYDSQWKIGFLKRLLKVNLPYIKIFKLLKKIAN